MEKGWCSECPELGSVRMDRYGGGDRGTRARERWSLRCSKGWSGWGGETLR